MLLMLLLSYLYQGYALGAKRASKNRQTKRRSKKHGGSFGMGELFWSGDEILWHILAR